MSESSERQQQMLLLKEQQIEHSWLSSKSGPTTKNIVGGNNSSTKMNEGVGNGGVELLEDSMLLQSGAGATTVSSALQSRNFKVAVDIMIRWYRAFGGSVRADELKNFINCFLEEVVRMQPSILKQNKSTYIGSIIGNAVDVFHCPICFGILTEPVTALCGHSYCRKCLQKERPGQSTCRRCRHNFTQVDCSQTKTNVLLGSLIEKWWATDLAAAKCRTEGNSLFEANEGEKALAKYSQALSLVSTDHLTLGNLSHVLLTLGRSEEALAGIDGAIKNCPFWGKGYFRKSVVLTSLGRYEEAFVNLAICAGLVMLGKTHEDTSVTPVKGEMLKVLHRIFLNASGSGVGGLRNSNSSSPCSSSNSSTCSSTSSIRRHSSDPCSPYPTSNNLKYHHRTGSSEMSTESECSSVDEESSPEHHRHSHQYQYLPHRPTYHQHNHHHHHLGKVSRKRNSSNADSGSNCSSNISVSNNKHSLKISSLASSTSSVGQQAQMVRITRIFERALQDVRRKYSELTASDSAGTKGKIERPVDPAAVSASDLECTLCYRLLHEPITTQCGHTYCRSCLERSLDHSPLCPLCKTSLQDYMGHRKPAVNQFIQAAIVQFLPKDHAERVEQHLEDIAADVSASRSDNDNVCEVPIFVCTMAFPSVPCPLHVFEPKYRLMIRRCMEAGTRKFGMCCYVEGGEHNYGDVGTLLEIQNVQYFPDGRSVVDTIGRRRFKVLNKAVKDGYNVARIELLKDRPLEPETIPQLEAIHNQVYLEAKEWLESVSQVLRQRIVTHFGTMPAPEENWMETTDGPAWTWWLLAILPLVNKAQLAILGMTSLQKRLESIQKVLRYVTSKQQM